MSESKDHILLCPSPAESIRECTVTLGLGYPCAPNRRLAFHHRPREWIESRRGTLGSEIQRQGLVGRASGSADPTVTTDATECLSDLGRTCPNRLNQRRYHFLFPFVMPTRTTVFVGLWLLAAASLPTTHAWQASPWTRSTLRSSSTAPPSARSVTTQRSRLASAVATADEPPLQGTGTASIPQEVFNLVKGIVGAGVLSLPSGIAAFGNAPSAVLPAVLLISLIGALSAYGFALIGRVCSLTGTTSYRDAWNESVSPKTSWITAWSVTFMTINATLAYSMILGETFQSLLLTAGYAWSKTKILALLTTTVLLPLCLLKNLSSLAPFSLLGSLGMVYTAIAMGIRYVTKAYVGTGKFAADLPRALQPSFGAIGASGVYNAKASILLGMLSTAYMAHFNAPKFYTELRNNTVPRYVKVVATSFGISIALFATMASLGFLTFGAASSGLILNNYSIKDNLMGLSRIAVAVSLVFSYPLAFVGARDGILDVANVAPEKRSTGLLNALTVGLLSLVTGLALVIPDVSFVMAFGGSTLGNALIYIFPALMFRGAVRKLKAPTKGQRREVKLAMTSALVGLGMGVVGAVKAVQSVL
ncbi:predicted protein [Phaeodactylum tricornutum CCAP 1055/1]|uniref:Amino acid transporter transmembrane domain-containing protein n=1 Tax=Phaeodactylum tricornutum (strain CCAP 1055/1) TaxID=556484 RepID=B7GD40_PHATC|nr:predicted protein [Phaeodactylum tricornutum CCAP 1055/1]EEC43431.1 predicted protein [Phaeodactylum tricornutum CCAP 1055/1]|eukprot:XP_002184984.1 predicted protein [Phaeodactylum tricornutum CCAP 1055/1]